jgi:hypothetical protein
MAKEFDAYHKWLGIPKEDQPPHYYRLLAIRMYEDDPQVIEAAADRQMGYLRRYQAGEYGEQARRLLGEVSRARLCLLKPAAKAKYDAKLEQQLAQAAAESAGDGAAGSQGSPLDVISDIEPIEIQVTERPATPIWQQPTVIASVLGGVVAVVIVLIFASVAGNPGGDNNARNGANSADGGKGSSKSRSTAQSDSGEEAGSRRRNSNFQARPLATGDKPNWSTFLDPDEPSEEAPGAAKGVLTSKPPVVAAKDNLIFKIDLKRDVVQGDWKLDNGVLISGIGYRDRIQIPTKVPDSYTLTVVAERPAEKGFGLLVYLPVGKSMALATLDGWNGETSGLELIDNKEGDINETMTVGVFTRRGLNTFVYKVQPNQILIEANGVKVLDWRGDSSLFTIHPQYAVPRSGELGLATFAAQWRIQSVALVPKPQVPLAPGPAPDGSAFPIPGFKVPVIGVAENLIQKIDPVRDAVQGKWKVESGVLLAPAGLHDRIRIPGKAPASYTLTVLAEKKKPGGFGLSMILPVGKGQAIATIDGWTGRSSGMGLIDGAAGDANEMTTFARLIKPGLNTFVCRVTPQSARVEVNGRKAVDWKGDSSKLALPTLVALPKTDEIGIVGGAADWQILGIKLESGGSKESLKDTPKVAGAKNFFDTIQGSLVPEKLPIPAQAELDTARKAIRELFKTEYAQAKKQPDGKLNLATTLFSKGQEANSDHAVSYVMLSEAADLAAEVGQLGLSWDIIVALTDQFEGNRFLMMEKAAKTASPQVRTFEDMRTLTAMYGNLAGWSMEVNEYDIAARAMQAASAGVRKPLFANLKEPVNAANKRIAGLKEAFDAVKSARETLQTNANDPVASFAWGRFLCFYKRNWADGLPLLAAGIDPIWSPLAQRELGLSEMSPPPEGAIITKLGDDWWAAADKEKEPLRSVIQQHAAEAYGRAQADLTGLAKTAVQQKADRVFGATKIVETSGDQGGVLVAPVELNPGNTFTIEFWVATQATTGAILSKRQNPDGESSIVVSLQEGLAMITSSADLSSESTVGKTKINDGGWHHLAAVKLGKHLLLFVDGKKEAEVEGAESFSSKSAWKAGCSTGLDSVAARVCRIRVSNTARYLFPFDPETQYGKDSATVYPK